MCPDMYILRFLRATVLTAVTAGTHFRCCTLKKQQQADKEKAEKEKKAKEKNKSKKSAKKKSDSKKASAKK